MQVSEGGTAMHPEFHQMVMRDRQREIERSVQISALRRTTPAAGPFQRPVDPVVLRLCCVSDDGPLERLAQLQGRPAPRGRHVVAEVGGSVVAALPLAGGAPLADPFRPTAHLLPLLELRAKQIGLEPAPRRPLRLLTAVRALTPARR
jgi:hypothetical protein